MDTIEEDSMDLNILTPGAETLNAGAEILNLSQSIPNKSTIQIIQTDNSLGPHGLNLQLTNNNFQQIHHYYYLFPNREQNVPYCTQWCNGP